MRHAGILALLCVLGAGPVAQAAKRGATPPPAAPAGPTLEDRQAVFGPVDEAFQQGRKAEVADLLVEITQNADHLAFHAEAYARLTGTEFV